MLSSLTMMKTVMQLARLQRCSTAHLRELQEKRFRELLRFAIQNSAYYRDRFHGIDPEHCRLSDVPTLCKSELMANFDRLVTDPAIKLADAQRFLDDKSSPGRLYLGRYSVWHTSGSEGQPTIVLADRREMALICAVRMARGNCLPKTYRNVLRHLLRRSRVATVRVGRALNPSGAMLDYTPRAVRPFVKILALQHSEGIGRIVERLNEFRPHFLTGYPHVLESLAEQERSGRLRLRGGLVQITSIAEPLSSSVRETLQNTFAAPVLDIYAMGECIQLSEGCPQFGGSHVNMDLAMLEVVDGDNQPVNPGAAGSRVLVTNLCNHVQPLIRYEVNDVVTISPKPCPCGSP